MVPRLLAKQRLSLTTCSRALLTLAWSLLPAAVIALGNGRLPALELILVVDDLAPVDIGHTGDGSGRLILATTDGTLRTVEDGQLSAEVLLDIRDRVVCCGEQGLTAFAFHPEFQVRGEVFVLYTSTAAPLSTARDSVLSRIHLAVNGSNAFDPDSEQILLRIPQPMGNHNGNDLEFGPDGFLYISTGDGGGQEDEFQNGQNGLTLNGKILRIDIDGGDPESAKPYSVPANNPFIGNPMVLDEIWALGLRNPWRMGFDRLSGDLWIADAGQDRWEEVNRVPGGSGGGQNFGWSELDGNECFLTPGCNLEAYEPPVVSYCHAEVAGCEFGGDCSIVGARRYRGHRSPSLVGWLVMVDFCSGRIRGARPGALGWDLEVLLDSEESFLTLGEDENGELYVSTFHQMFRIEGLPGGFADDFEIGGLAAWSAVIAPPQPSRLSRAPVGGGDS